MIIQFWGLNAIPRTINTARMSKFILQVTFDKRYQELLLKVQEYCCRFSDRSQDYFNNNLISSLYLKYEGDSLCIQVPKTQEEEFTRDIIIFTLQYLFQAPLLFGEEDLEPSSVEQLYSTFITTDLPADKELHLLSYLSLDNASDIRDVERLISSFPGNLDVKLDVMLLPVDLYAKKTDEELSLLKGNLERLISIKKAYPDLFGNIFYSQTIDNKGAVHEYDFSTLVDTLAPLTLALINGYDGMSSFETEFPITTFGISKVQIDKFSVVDNWSQHYLQRLIRPLFEKADDNLPVDKAKIQRVLNRILQEERRIVSSINTTNDANEDVANVFKQSILDAILSEDLNPKERKYLLDCCLGLSRRTPESLETSDIHEIPLPDEVFSELLQEFNGNEKYQELKAVIGKIQEVKKRIAKRVELLEEKKRHLQDNYPFDGELSEDGFIIHGERYKPYSYREVPLATDFEPKAKDLPNSADLRKYFSVIKNQGEQGSCASFSLVSVFEYFLSNEESITKDLSEAFVYYNARKIGGQEDQDSGTTLQKVIETMSSNGVCIEELCPYNENSFANQPSPEAYSDAEKRKVTSAQNVSVNLDTIKAAISEGYPVVASFRVFDSFAKNVGGFVPMPSKSEMDSEKEEYHAMVICGYSDEHHYVIVRNSWGKRFGDEGYCYIPYAYLREKGLVNYACAITGVDVDILKHHAEKFKYNLQEKDDNIQYSVLANQLAEEEYRLNEDKDTLRILQKQYISILQSIKSGSCLDDIENELSQRAEEKQAILSQLKSEKASVRFSSKKLFNIVHIAVAVLSFITSGIGLYLHLYQDKNWLTTIIGGSILISCLVVYIIRAICSRKKQHAIQKRIDEIENDISWIRLESQKKRELQKRLALIIANVDTFSDNSIMRKQLLEAIENLLSNAYSWIAARLAQHDEPLMYSDSYHEIAGVIKDKWGVLKRLFVDDFSLNKIKDVFHLIQKDILNHFYHAFNLRIEDFYRNDSVNMREFRRNISNTVILSQLVLTGNEPYKSVYFSNNNQVQIPNCIQVQVNNNQYLYILLRYVNIDNLTLFNKSM